MPQFDSHVCQMEKILNEWNSLKQMASGRGVKIVGKYENLCENLWDMATELLIDKLKLSEEASEEGIFREEIKKAQRTIKNMKDEVSSSGDRDLQERRHFFNQLMEKGDEDKTKEFFKREYDFFQKQMYTSGLDKEITDFLKQFIRAKKLLQKRMPANLKQKLALITVDRERPGMIGIFQNELNEFFKKEGVAEKMKDKQIKACMGVIQFLRECFDRGRQKGVPAPGEIPATPCPAAKPAAGSGDFPESLAGQIPGTPTIVAHKPAGSGDIPAASAQPIPGTPEMQPLLLCSQSGSSVTEFTAGSGQSKPLARAPEHPWQPQTKDQFTWSCKDVEPFFENNEDFITDVPIKILRQGDKCTEVDHEHDDEKVAKSWEMEDNTEKTGAQQVAEIAKGWAAQYNVFVWDYSKQTDMKDIIAYFLLEYTKKTLMIIVNEGEQKCVKEWLQRLVRHSNANHECEIKILWEIDELKIEEQILQRKNMMASVTKRSRWASGSLNARADEEDIPAPETGSDSEPHPKRQRARSEDE